MKRIRILQALGGALVIATAVAAQTATGFAPNNFGNVILTSTPSNATGASGVSSVYTSSGTQFTFGTGGSLVDPMQFNYVLTGPNTATITQPATATTPAATTNLVFTGANRGTYTMVSGTNTTTGRFGLATIPAAAPIENVSARSTITANGSTTVGFVIAGTMPRRVLIRAVGPGLAAFGVTNAITNPSLALYRGNQVLARNDDWGMLQVITSSGSNSGATSGGPSSGTSSTGTSSGTTSSGTSTGTTSTGTGTTSNTGTGTSFFSGTLSNGAAFTTQLASASDFTSAGAFSLQQASKDAAFVVTLPPGAYTVVVSNSANGVSSTSSSGSTSGGTTPGTGSTSGPSTSTTTTGTTRGGTTTGTSTGTTTSTGTSTGTTTVGTSTGTGSTSGGTATGTGTTSSGTTSGGTTIGTATTTSGTGTAAATTTSGDVLVEVYFLE